MRDAVSLISKHVVLSDDRLYKIEDFYFVPGNDDLYVKLKCTKSQLWLNYPLSNLLPILKDQISL